MFMKSKPPNFPLFLITALIMSAISFIWTLAIPADSRRALLFGLSPLRLLLAAVPLAIFTLSGAVFFFVFLRLPTKTQEAAMMEKLRGMPFLAPLSFWLSITSFTVLLLGEPALGFSAAVVQRLRPVLLLLFLFFGQTGCLALRASQPNREFGGDFNWKSALFFLGIGFILYMAGSATGLGYALASPYASKTGIPLLPRQIVVSLYVAGTYACLEALLPKQSRDRMILSVLAAIVLYVLAASLWMGVRIPENHFTHASNLGDGEFALYSDSLTYDANAHKMLLGYGLASGKALPRPLYSFFLGIIHLLAGPGVKAAIDAQTYALAIIPVLIFWLGKRNFSAPVGMLGAFLFIFRETNQAALSGVYTLSSARMLMTELFTALCLIILAITAMKWLKNPMSRTHVLMTGALLGFTALIRTQVLVFFPLLALWGLLAQWRQRNQWPKTFLWLLTGLLLVILPWMGRNAIRAGLFTFEDPAYAARTLVVHDAQGETGAVLDSATGNPLEFMAQTFSYLANNLTSSLNQLPWHGGLGAGLDDFIQVKPEPPYYPGSPPFSGQSLFFLLHLVVIILGLAAAWESARWGGMLPIGIYFSYALSSSLARYSGWRFILPVDWVVLLYWAMGVTAFIRLPANLPKRRVTSESPAPKESINREWPLGLLLGAALFFGLVVPVGESLFPKRMELYDKAAIQQKLMDTSAPQAIRTLAADPSARLAQGVLLYPVYLEDERAFNRMGITNTSVRSEKPVLRFIALGDGSPVVYLPANAAPKGISPGERVIVVGCMRDDVFFAAGVLIEREKPRWLLSDGEIPLRCEN